MKTWKSIFKSKQVRKECLYSFLILMGIRLLATSPTPGTNPDYFKTLIHDNSALTFIDAMTGNGLSGMSIMALSITPYITASIMVQLAGVIYPHIHEMEKGMEDERKRIHIITLVLGGFVALMESSMIAISFGKKGLLVSAKWYWILLVMLIWTAGSVVASLAGELIRKKYDFNGSSLILLFNILASYPSDALSVYQTMISEKQIAYKVISSILIVLFVIALFAYTVCLQAAERRIPITHSQKIKGASMKSTLPLKACPGTVVPIIFASSILTFPSMIAAFIGKENLTALKFLNTSYWFQKENFYYSIGAIFYIAMIIVICATDSDREGDLIMDYLYRYMQCKTPYSRAIFYEQSQESFQKAFLPENLVSSTGRLSVIESGRARSTGDFIVGMNLTVACTLKYPNNGVLSIGRVQTAVLNMIVQRENEIHNFKPTPYFVLQGKFATQKGIQYIGTHVSQKIPNAQEAHKLLSKLQNGSHVGVIFNLNTEQIKKKKPYLYDLSTLQMDANKKYGFSLSKTLSLAQKLYENGYITYPRTDSIYLPDDMGEEMQRTIDHLMSLTVYSEYNTGRRVDPLDRHYFDSHKVSSHYAIVPTPKAGMPTGDEGKLYDLIARSVICMLFPDAVFNKTKFQTVVENEVFETTGMTLVSAGFLAVLGVPKDKIIPNVKNGESVTADFEALKKETEPPKRYTDATLLNAMINCGKTLEDEELRRLMAGKPGERPLGLGRPSSQASIVQTLEDRQYIEKKGKTIIPTTKGINLIACFPVQELKSAVMTAQWEKRLDDIENGMDSYESFLSDLQASVRNWTDQVITAPINPILGAGKEGKMTDYTCPICGKKMEEYLNMYGCSGHKEKTCDFKVPKKVCGVTLKAADLDSLFKNGQTQTIKGFVSKEKKKFNARLIVDRESGKVKFYFPPAEETELTCPFCNKSLKKYDWGYACPDRSGCGFHLGTNVCKHELTEDEVRQILVDGRTANYISFVSKKGNKFRAAIVLDRDSKQTKFETEEW